MLLLLQSWAASYHDALYSLKSDPKSLFPLLNCVCQRLAHSGRKITEMISVLGLEVSAKVK